MLHREAGIPVAPLWQVIALYAAIPAGIFGLIWLACWLGIH